MSASRHKENAATAEELSAYRLLVVEDEFFLPAELEEVLMKAGAETIGPLASVDEALGQVRADGFDLAVLDINLGGNTVYPVADALAEKGAPFMFASPYTASEIPARQASDTFGEALQTESAHERPSRQAAEPS